MAGARAGSSPETQDAQRTDRAICEFAIDRQSIDENNRTAEVSFSSETPVQDSFFGPPRVLLHEPRAIDFGPLRQHGATLINHDVDQVVGRISDPRVRDDRRGVATIVFDDDPESERQFRKVVSGSLRGISVRFSVQRAQRIGENETWTSPSGQEFRGGSTGLEVATRWTPREISLTPLPADTAVGVGRGQTKGDVPMFSAKTLQRLAARGLTQDMFENEAAAIRALDALDQQTRGGNGGTQRSDPPPSGEPDPAPAPEGEPAGDPGAANRQASAAPNQATIDQMVAGALERALPTAVAGAMTQVTTAQTWRQDMAARIQDPEAVARWAEAGASEDQISREVIDKLSRNNPTPQFAATERGLDQLDKVRETAIGAICNRNRLAYEKPEGFKEEIPRSVVIWDVARLLLEARGVRLPPFSQRMDYIRAALGHTSGDFPDLLSNIANKAMQVGYNEATTTYQRWTRREDTSDFKAASRPQIGEVQNFEEVPDGMPIPESTISDKGETTKLRSYGRKMTIGRQAFMNDDQGAFTTIPAMFGAAGRRTINLAVYTHFTQGANNRGPTLDEGSPSGPEQLFSDHDSGSNLLLASALTNANLGAARTLIKRQKLLTATVEEGAVTPSTAKFNANARFLLIPVSLEQTADEIVNGTFMPTVANQAQTPFQRALEIIADAELDEVSVDDWYLLAPPNEVSTVEVTRLAGQEGPEFEQLPQGDALGFSWIGWLDFNVQALEHRGMVKGEA